MSPTMATIGTVTVIGASLPSVVLAGRGLAGTPCLPAEPAQARGALLACRVGAVDLSDVLHSHEVGHAAHLSFSSVT